MSSTFECFFTIIIPTYNRANCISETITSVLNQTFGNFELLVIDNQSTDSTKEIVCSFKDERIFFYQNEQNFERCYSRNLGIKLTKGNYILLLDSDDLYEPDHLSNWYRFILSNDTNSDCFYVSDKKILKEKELYVQKNPIIQDHPVCYFFLNPIIPGQVCVPSTVMKKYFFRNDLLIFEDAAMWMELSLNNKVAFNSINSFVYRLHEDNSINEQKNNVYYTRLKALRIILRERKYNKWISLNIKRKNINASIMGIIRFNKYNSHRFKGVIWTLYAILFYPEFALKNKILIMLSFIPILSRLPYFRSNFFSILIYLLYF